MKSNQKHNCWLHINQHIREEEFERLEQIAVNFFTGFIVNQYYGNGIQVFRFDIYIEASVNFGRQTDSIYTECAHLSAHIDKQIFDNSNDEMKIKILLNTVLVLIKYLTIKIPLPKGYRANDLYLDFTSFLADNELLLHKNDVKKIVIKHFDTTRFDFKITETAEVDKNKIKFDLNNIQDYINNKIAGKTFGK